MSSCLKKNKAILINVLSKLGNLIRFELTHYCCNGRPRHFIKAECKINIPN